MLRFYWFLSVLAATPLTADSLKSVLIQQQLKQQQLRRTPTALLSGGLFDVVPLPVAVVGAAGLIFGLFNIPQNDIDLTDQGLARARLARRKAKLDRGEQLPDTSGLDPYRYKFFEEDIGEGDDLDVIMGRKKGGGGCG